MDKYRNEIEIEIQTLERKLVEIHKNMEIYQRESTNINNRIGMLKNIIARAQNGSTTVHKVDAVVVFEA